MQAFTNCVVVSPDETFRGTVTVEGGRIRDVDRGISQSPSAYNLEGRHLIPGLVETHTDNLERHLQPRSTRWPANMALLAHDAQVCAVGITTVLDAVCIGVEHDLQGNSRDFAGDTVLALRHARQSGHLRADHMLHFRCELPHPNLIADFEQHADAEELRLVSLMDHTPGQRQTTDLNLLRRGYERMGAVSDEWFHAVIRKEQDKQSRYANSNRKSLMQSVRQRGLVAASHDDANEEHVAEAVRDGIGISEFPTTMEAASAARRYGMKTVMGAPNIVLGGSQSGNVAASAAAKAGLLDALSSDYAPVSLLGAAFQLHRDIEIPLEEAIAMVTAQPAAMVGLHDRGSILPGRRADLVEVEANSGLPIARGVWREGVRVA